MLQLFFSTFCILILQNTEDEFIEKRNNLLSKLNKNIMDYINKNSITTTVPHPYIYSVDFNIKEWCSEFCKLDEDELESMEAYIHKLFSESQDDIDELHLLMRKITKLYSYYRKKVEWNIKKIKNTYGKRLEYEFHKENQYIDELSSIKDLVQQMYDTMCSNNQYDEDEDLLNDITELKQNINSLYERLDSLEDNLIDEIDIANDNLLDK